MINVWLCQVKSDSNLLIVETYFVFMQNLGLISNSTSCTCKDSKPLVTNSRQKRAHRSCAFYFVFHPGLFRDSWTQLPQKWSAKITNSCLSPDCHSGRDWKHNLHQYQLSPLGPFGAGSCSQTPHSFQVRRPQKNLHPLPAFTNGQWHLWKSRESLHTFSFLHLRKGLEKRVCSY